MKSIVRKFKNYYFEICFATVIAFILGFGLYCKVKGKQGSWSRSYYYEPDMFTLKHKPHTESTKKQSSGEIECRRVLQHLFSKPFPSVRPNFLQNPVTRGGNNLELDCYNDELRLAVEYNGQQHYKYVPYFHSSHEAFRNQQYRDEIKRRICQDNGITLIEVPYTIKTKDIASYLVNELGKRGYLR